MGFASWVAVWFGLTIPAIIMLYLFKRKYVETIVPSHLLWNKVLRNMEANRPWQKLQNRLLLWLQLLVALLLVLALMKPYLHIPGYSTNKHTLIVADISASMLTEYTDSDSDTGMTRLDEMKRQMNDYIDGLRRGSEITFITIGREPNVILLREKEKQAWIETIDSLTVDYGVIAYRETLSLASAISKDIPDTNVVIFTDEQWTEPTPPIQFEAPVQVISTYQDNVMNVAVEQFGVKLNPSTQQVSGIAVLRNYSSADLEVVLDLYGDKQLLDTKQMVIVQGQSVTVSFDELETAKVYRLATLLSTGRSDSYAPDNTAFAFLEQGGGTDVLLLSKGNLFLEKALQLIGAKVTRMDVSEGNGQGLEGVATVPGNKPDIIIIEGTSSTVLAEQEWATLIRSTPVWTIGGEGAKHELTEGKVSTSQHPVMRYMQFNQSPVASLIDAELPEWANPIMSIDGKTAIYAGKEEGSERLHFLFSLSDSDLPLRPEFPILVNQAIEWLISGRDHALGRVNAGSGIDVSIDADAVNGQWVPVDGYVVDDSKHVKPSKSSDPSDPSESNSMSALNPPVVMGENGAILSSQKAPAVPGLWRLELNNSDSVVVSSYDVEVSANRLESAVNRDKMTSSITDDHLEHGGQSTDQTVNQSTSSYPLLYWIVWLVLLVMLLEWGVYQRGRSI